jgi:hypothetical protein
MWMRTLGVVLMLATTTTFAQPVVTPNKSKPVDPTDPIMTSVDEWQAKEIAKIEWLRADGSRWKFKQPSEYYSEASRKVFSEWRFLMLSWDEIPAEKPAADPTEKKKPFPNRIAVHLAISPDRRTMQEFHTTGNYEEFGVLLAHQGIKIETPDDATAVWNAFCDVHWKHWHKQKHEKINDRLWHLGSITIDEFHYYYQVDLDADHKVQRGKLKADRVGSTRP